MANIIIYNHLIWVFFVVDESSLNFSSFTFSTNMSNFYLFGNFTIASATQVFSKKQTAGKNSINTFHYIYDTTIKFYNAFPIQVNLRVYIIYVYAKAYVPVDEHGCALGTNTPLFAAFQYSLTVRHI